MPPSHYTLAAGGFLLLMVFALTRQPPVQLLRPARSTALRMGLLGGLVSVLMFATLVAGVARGEPAAGLPAVTATPLAFVAMYFGPAAAAITAILALSGLVLAPEPDVRTAVVILVAMVACGLFWRWLESLRPRYRAWTMVGMGLSTPWLYRGALILSGTQEAPPLPLHISAGLLVLGTTRLLMVAKAATVQALQKANQQLQEGQEQLRLVMEALGGGRWEWDVPTRTFRCHGRLYESFGLTSNGAQDGAQDGDLWARWYALRHPQDAARNAAQLQQSMQGLHGTYEAEFRVRDLQGQWRWILTRGTAAERAPSGQVLRMVGMDIDVTGQREVEHALRTSEAKYTTIYQTLPDPAGISRVSDGRYVDVNPAFCQLLGFEREQVIGKTSIELNIWASVEERRRLIETFERDGRVDRLPMTAQRNGLQIPGLMSASTVTIEQEECFVFVFHDMTESHRAASQLVQLNNLLQQAGRLARLGAWEHERDKGLVYWSDVCFDIHGLPPDAPLPMNYIAQQVHADYREGLRERLRKSLHQGLEWDYEMPVRHTSGRDVWVRVRGGPVWENGEITRVRGVLQDIDAAKQAEQQLRQSEDRFARIFQLMPFPMGLSRYHNGEYVEINPAWEQLTGIPRAEALGQTPVTLGILSAGDRERMPAHADPSGHLASYETTIYTRRLGPRIVLQSMRAVDLDGQACWLFSVQDITDRKRNEEQIREREELLSLTISAAALSLWDWNLPTGTITGDARWRQLQGLGDGRSSQPAALRWDSTVPPEDVERINAEVQRHASHPDTPFDATWRLALPGNDNRWVRSLGKIVSHGPDGKPLRMLGVAIDVTSQREQEVLLQRMAHYDALTGLPNRVLLASRLQEAMHSTRRKGTQLGVAYLDLDGFKPVNDRLGHGAGDRLLVAVARRLTGVLRPHDCVARLGGDEFVILMPQLTSHSDCERLLHRVMESISAPYAIDTDRVQVTASIGYTIFPSDDADADTLLRHADQAMYNAKQAGRNRFHQFDAAHEKAQQFHQQKERHVHEALTQEQFVLYLQPKVDMRSGAVVGAEALARWQHPERGVLPPSEFLPYLEGSALEIAFGEWVVRAALQVQQRLQAQGMHLPLSINITAHHLQNTGFADWMAQCIAHYPEVGARQIEIEITESAELYDLARVANALHDLREIGVTIALDDFGTGYSSLTYLRRLPMDTLKIDRSFVHGMLNDPGDLAIVQGVIGLSRSFGYDVIAEGVETLEQGQQLLQLGCHQAQGFFIARPMSVETFIAWANTWRNPEGWQAAGLPPLH